MEQLGVQRSIAAAENAELVLAVIDGSEEPGAAIEEILQTAKRAKKAILIRTKADLQQRCCLPDTDLPSLRISSMTGEGIDDLEHMISELFPMPQVPAGEILTNVRQADAVRRAAESMQEALAALKQGMTPDIILTETDEAMAALGELTGTNIREDITNQIFSRFCVGK